MRRVTRAVALVLLAGTAVAGGRDDAGPRVRPWLESGPAEKSFDVVFVGDGYVRDQLGDAGKFWKDVGRYAKRFLEEPPFCWYRARTNVRAVFLESQEEGCARDPTHPRKTALGCAFDSAGGRFLTFVDAPALAGAVERACGADVVFVMVNTERYGGGGTTLDSVKVRGRSLPAPTFAAQDTASFMIAVHELGHSLADLDDEYAEAAQVKDWPLPSDGADLHGANVTLPAFVDPSSKTGVKAATKWAHFAKLPGGAERKWAFEGGYYRDKGVYRPWLECRMRKHGDPFCPVCCEEMAKAIQAALGDPWDDATYHAAHPLPLWR